MYSAMTGYEQSSTPSARFAVNAPMSQLDVEDASEFWTAAREMRESRSASSRDVWESEVTAIAAQLVAAKARLNAFCPIYALPDEVLAHIFGFLSALYPVRAISRQWGWLCVTHVSRRFRVASIDHAVLWSKLSIDGETPWRIFLPRSQHALLDIHGDAEMTTNYRSAVYAVQTLQNIERVRALDIRRLDSGGWGADTWQPILNSVASELRVLRVTVNEVFSDDWTDGSEEIRGHQWSAIDLRSLNRNAPKLSELNLTGLPILWRMDAQMMLSSLSITHRADIELAQYHFSDLMRSLQNMPMLQELCLRRVIPPSTDDSVNMRVNLPHLQLLFSAEPDGRCHTLWSSLEIPPDCTIQIEAGLLDIEGATRWKALLLDQLVKPRCPVYRRVRFGNPRGDRSEDEGIYLSVHPELGSEHTDSSSTKAHPMLSFVLSFVGIPESFCELFGISYVESPQIPVDYEERFLLMRCLIRLLKQFTALEEIEFCALSDDYFWDEGDHKLERMFCACFVDELSPPFKSTAADLDAAQFLPNIHTLSLRNAHLRCTSFYWPEDRLHDVLGEALSRRKVAGMPIHTVRLYQTKVNPTWLLQWQLCVSELYCDPTCSAALDCEEYDESEVISDGVWSQGLEEEGEVSEVEEDDDEVESEGGEAEDSD
ncbi:hypothetical protein PENSPDRAFT_754409 [Peniophora sp. CONT]|nr:hypothetical protein PENSPDRAFT_754409 [Peniophora sp. CONT]